MFQVDERVAPDGDADRNLTHLRESLLSRVDLPAANLHAMPVGRKTSPAAAAAYARDLATTPAGRALSTWSTSDSARTATPRPSSPATRCSR